ncbi:hypothetical protein MMYC01_200409 [Madurella mycetomatis]|uniref:Uncharacterized protein n=1 Tax=Madurella mycetomatis TaxID=100816 RepID=A0A175WHC9_9PEZI|nr:hypothetical protein MMYC01_200409 [Madurella mycetomatis]
MRTSSVKRSTSVVDQAEYFTTGLHLPQHSDGSGSRAPEVDPSAAFVAASINLYIQMSSQPSSYSTAAQPTSRPSPPLEQIRSSTANISKPDYCKAHLLRDAPFTAFRLVGKGSNNGVDTSTVTIVSHRSVDVNSATQTVSRALAGAESATSWTSRSAKNLTHCYPTKITDEDLLDMDARNTSPRL